MTEKQNIYFLVEKQTTDIIDLFMKMVAKLEPYFNELYITKGYMVPDVLSS